MAESPSNHAAGRSAETSRDRGRWGPPILSVLVGLLLGAAITMVVGWKSMPGLMLTVHESKYSDVDRTCEELRKAIEANGWHCPAVRDMNQSMAKQGVQFDRPVRIVELCKADYAKRVLSRNPEVSTLMPCAWGVYEGPDGKVYISGMNMCLMGKIFGGTIAEVMGRDVSADEHRILQAVTKP
jgi:uncharacterized protein (DUF302 family)